MNNTKSLITLILSIISITTYAQNGQTMNLSMAQRKAEEVYKNLSLDEKIGQLYMVAAYSGGKNYNESQILNLISKEGIGGLIFMQGSIPSQIALTNKYQAMSKIPLLLSMDAEWGIGMRMNEVKDFAKNIEVGATYNAEIARELGAAIAEQCKRIGVHINFGPVVDINNNPNNPVINFRSFGEDKYNVSNLGWGYADGMQNNKIMACAKHFPGHGDTDVDSHKDLPAIHKSYSQLWENELFPYRELIPKGIASVMIAHLMVPSITQSNSLPTTLSYNCVTGLLRDSLKFNGLVFTDALNMQGVAKYYSPGDIDLKAFQAGADVLLFSQNVASGKSKIKSAINNGSISEQRLKQSVIRILTAKFMFGAYDRTTISSSYAIQDLNKRQDNLNRIIAKNSVTLARDNNNLVFNQKPGARVLYLILGKSKLSQSLMKNKGADVIDLSSSSTNSQLAGYLRNWEARYDKIVVGIHNINKYPNGNYGLSSSLQNAANYLARNSKKVLILVNGNPYALKYFCDAPSLMVNYEETDYNMDASLDVIMGYSNALGRLPVSPCSGLSVGAGLVPQKTPKSSSSPSQQSTQSKKKSSQKVRVINVSPSHRSPAYHPRFSENSTNKVDQARALKNNVTLSAASDNSAAASKNKYSESSAITDILKASFPLAPVENRKDIKNQIVESTITIVKDDNKLLENGSPASKILYVYIGKMKVPKSVINSMGVYSESLSANPNYAQLNNYLNKWSGYEKILVGVHGGDIAQKNFGYNQNTINIANFIANNSDKACLLIYGDARQISLFCDAPSIILNHSESPASLEAAINVAKGKLKTRGKIAISPCDGIPAGSGISYTGNSQTSNKNWQAKNPVKDETDSEIIEDENLGSTAPATSEVPNENISLPIYSFAKLDEIANTSIAQGVFPGCQILVSKDGKVVYSKSFGKQIYGKSPEVTNDMVYDIASITKIAATTLAVMKLYDESKIDLDKRLGDYLSWTKGTNKENVTVRELLLHQGGMKSWIPFYKETVEDGHYLPGIYTPQKNLLHNIPVARNLFIMTSYPDTIWKEVLESPLGSKRYVYSDLDFMFLQKIVESITATPLDVYVQNNFYRPMGLSHIGFNPALSSWISLSKVIPTEHDDYFRMQLLQGFVHDPGAAMLGGVAGHAGLFCSSYDLYVLMQALIDGGKIKGRQYFKPETIELFTKYNSNISRRGLGFDKPDKSRPGGPTGDRCSSATFGHQGFTGTCVWADPTSNVVFVFLSNRVYPTQENKKISRYDVRTRLQDEAYKAMGL